MDVTLLLATRYLTAIGVTCFLWDYLLTFHQEVKYIWTQKRWSTSHHAFVWKRYTSLLGLLYGAFLTSGIQNPVSNKISFVAVTTVAVVATAVSHGCLALRLFVLWDQKKSAKVALWVAFVVSFIGLFTSFVFAAQELYHRVSYSSLLVQCIVNQNPKAFMGIWVSMLSFDVVTVGLAIGNALDQPYQQRFQVIERIKRDGALSFLAVVAASIVMLTISVTGSAGSIFEVTFLCWVSNAIVECRLVLRVVPVTSRYANHTFRVTKANDEIGTWQSDTTESY
ncbi:hypothetical protein NM688_g6455 [Phlebia brevispora]|uniref:Uncharacterized protein n=1 Tax=Phlebia brevispora TaxID=194682 RepID=A0ACC1SFV7_9APHY|nr:hypothetical protein NM688_g6455 [Phlebia brevispora]